MRLTDVLVAVRQKYVYYLLYELFLCSVEVNVYANSQCLIFRPKYQAASFCDKINTYGNPFSRSLIVGR